MKTFVKHAKRKLLYLLVVAATGTLIAVSGTGAVGFGPAEVLVSVFVATAAAAVLPFAHRRLTRRTRSASAAASPGLARTKKILVLAMAAGAVAYFGGRGTFAIFTAETDNSANSMGSGTLVLGNTVGTSGTTCWSYTGSNKDNVNTGCTPLLAPSNMLPGASAAQTMLTIKNGGSLDASTFQLMAPWPRATLSTPLTSGVTPASLVLSSGLTVALSSGDQVTVTSAGYSQTFKVGTAGASVGATTIPLDAATPAANHDYPSGSRVEDVSGNLSPTNTDCYDTATSNATVPVVNATPGSSMSNIVIPSNNALCSAALFWVQEQTNGVNYCWAGRGAVGSASVSTVGQCRTPTTATLSADVSTTSTYSTLSVSALGGNIKAGDTLTITEGTHQDTVTTDSTTGNAYINGASVALSAPWTPTFNYTAAGATIKDTSAFDALNGDFTDTISNFDTFDRPSAPVTLYPLTSNTGAPNSTATVSLGKTGTTGNAGDTRTFYIGVYLPAWSSKPQNQLQGLISTFGITWYIQQ